MGFKGSCRRRFPLLWVALICSLFSGSQAAVHRYANGRFASSGNGFLFFGGSEGMRASTSENAIAGVANGKSYIRFDSVTFRRTKEAASKHSADMSNTGLVQAVIFDMSDRDKVGSANAICCTPDLVREEGCRQGDVIIRPSLDDPSWPFLIPVYFKGNSLEASLPSERVNISKTGLYNVYFVFCDPQLQGVVIDGATVWKNPTGYLPGSMAPLISFYGMLSLAYALLGLVWFSQCFKHWKDMVSLQNHLTVIIALGMLEVTFWYFEYANFNTRGHRPIGITLWAVTFGAIKKTLSRLLILAVSLGYGVVRPTVGASSLKVLILSATYFVAVEILDIFENVGTISDLSGYAKLFLVLPVAILDGCFILWIFVSLSKTLEKVEARRLVAKLDLYRKLTNTLSVAVVISVGWIGYEFYFKATDPYSERWQSAWTISAFWSALTFVLLCIICILWAPSENSPKYTYSEELRDTFDEEVVIPLKVVVEPENSTLKPTDIKKEKKPNTIVFNLDDDVEENKRE